jgi:predicted hotdog family 3-hydroxylacyl-ACP dehydratase
MNHDAICAHLPHAGRMCLLERLESWDRETITCVATSHREAHNPLCNAGRLHAVAGVEYAAQVMALHSKLLSTAALSPVEGTDTLSAIGYLASVRDLKFEIEDLGTISEDLRITTRRQSADASWFIYEFEIRAGTSVVVSGRLTAKLMVAGALA